VDPTQPLNLLLLLADQHIKKSTSQVKAKQAVLESRNNEIVIIPIMTAGNIVVSSPTAVSVIPGLWVSDPSE